MATASGGRREITLQDVIDNPEGSAKLIEDMVKAKKSGLVFTGETLEDYEEDPHAKLPPPTQDPTKPAGGFRMDIASQRAFPRMTPDEISRVNQAPRDPESLRLLRERGAEPVPVEKEEKRRFKVGEFAGFEMPPAKKTVMERPLDLATRQSMKAEWSVPLTPAPDITRAPGEKYEDWSKRVDTEAAKWRLALDRDAGARAEKEKIRKDISERPYEKLAMSAGGAAWGKAAETYEFGENIVRRLLVGQTEAEIREQWAKSPDPFNKVRTYYETTGKPIGDLTGIAPKTGESIAQWFEKKKNDATALAQWFQNSGFQSATLSQPVESTIGLAVDLPQIMVLGLPRYMAAKGFAQGGVPGAVEGYIRGSFLHEFVFKPVGMLDKWTTRYVASTASGVAMAKAEGMSNEDAIKEGLWFGAYQLLGEVQSGHPGYRTGVTLRGSARDLILDGLNASTETAFKIIKAGVEKGVGKATIGLMQRVYVKGELELLKKSGVVLPSEEVMQKAGGEWAWYTKNKELLKEDKANYDEYVRQVRLWGEKQEDAKARKIVVPGEGKGPMAPKPPEFKSELFPAYLARAERLEDSLFKDGELVGSAVASVVPGAKVELVERGSPILSAEGKRKHSVWRITGGPGTEWSIRVELTSPDKLVISSELAAHPEKIGYTAAQMKESGGQGTGITIPITATKELLIQLTGEQGYSSFSHELFHALAKVALPKHEYDTLMDLVSMPGDIPKTKEERLAAMFEEYRLNRALAITRNGLVASKIEKVVNLAKDLKDKYFGLPESGAVGPAEILNRVFRRLSDKPTEYKWHDPLGVDTSYKLKLQADAQGLMEGSEAQLSAVREETERIAGGPLTKVGSIIRPNADKYLYTADPDKLCPKSQRMRNTFAIVENALRAKDPNFKLDADQKYQIRNFMKSIGEEVGCVQCYTEGGRATHVNESLLTPLGDYKSGEFQKLMARNSGKLAFMRSHAGLRSFSNTDFKPFFIEPLIMLYNDAAQVGIHGSTYTKKLGYVDIFWPTGIRMSISLGGDIVNGRLVENLDVGTSWKGALSRRAKYPNVGTVFVAKSVNEVWAALDNALMDKIIPIHHSSVPTWVRQDAGVSADFTAVQGERWAPGADIAKGRAKYERICKSMGVPPHYTSKKFNGVPVITDTMHMGDKARFLGICEEIGLTPRFSKQVGPSDILKKQPSSDFTAHKNYMKLVGPETGKFGDNALKNITGKYDAAAVKKVIAEWERGGGMDIETAYSTTAAKKFIAELGSKPGQFRMKRTEFTDRERQ